MLTGKYTKTENEGSSATSVGRLHQFPSFQPRWMKARCLKATQRYCEIALKVGISPMALALQWILSREYMDHGSIVIGATNLSQLKDCVNAVKTFRTLSEETLLEIDEVHLSCKDPSQAL
eukprot:GHVQ01036499.1.p2 GENE.GHVQ01036499.1~~GHVQ01036499.1.p2  ORF type:complete len:120 (+),score=14.51 GHVQ01036499.1:1946-2305(+)